jgi:rubrerythrin
MEDFTGSEALPSARETIVSSEKSRQPKIKDLFAAAKKSEPTISRNNNVPLEKMHQTTTTVVAKRPQGQTSGRTNSAKCSPHPKRSKTDFFAAVSGNTSLPSSFQQIPSSWNCKTCTYLNENKPHGLVCSLCGTER